jgi:type II secretion system protein I
MRSAPPPSPGDARRIARPRRGFTLVEVLAALLMMAIVIPVAMEALSVSSRVGVLGQRKAAAMRVAERLLSELIVEGQTQQATSSGTLVEGDLTYPWTSRVENWPEDALQQLTVTVQFSVQGGLFDVSASTLVPPTIAELSAAADNAP